MSRKRLILKVIIVVVILLALVQAFQFGFEAGKKSPSVVKIDNVSNTEPLGTSTADFNPFWQIWEIIDQKHLKAEEIKDQDKVYGAISGLVRSLGDPYSEFFDPGDSQKFEEDIKGNFGGIGAEIGMKNDQIIIVAPLKDTPASRAGLEPQDQILKISSTSTLGLSIEEAVKLIRGEVGTKVTLTIFRDKWEKPKDIAITRETILIPTLDSEMKDGDISYISLYSFNANANSLFYQAMVKTLSQGSQGMVLDLRNNPGGYLQVSIDLAGWFLSRGDLVVSEVSRDLKPKEFRARGNAALKDMPVVVLINNGSASASEILAGALRDNRKVKLVGEKTFGKGTVQELEELRDGSSLKLTIAHWVLPSGKIIEGEGLEPDFKVELTEKDVEQKRDPQLEKAIEILKEEINKNHFTIFKL